MDAILVPIQKWPICPISVLRSKFYPRNINHMPAVKFLARLNLDQICLFLAGHYINRHLPPIRRCLAAREVESFIGDLCPGKHIGPPTAQSAVRLGLCPVCGSPGRRSRIWFSAQTRLPVLGPERELLGPADCRWIGCGTCPARPCATIGRHGHRV